LPDLKVLESTIKDELGKLRLLDKEKEGLEEETKVFFKFIESQ
jgi:hypothetical protein